MFIELGVVPYNGWTSPMVNLAQYNFKLLDKKNKIPPKYNFMDSYVDECFELENIFTATKSIQNIIEARYEKICLKQGYAQIMPTPNGKGPNGTSYLDK